MWRWARVFQDGKSQSAILIAYKFAAAVRNICLNPGPAPTDTWMGQSVWHWENDTLVVEVTSLDDQTWFDRSGNHHSDKLKVTERYTRTGPDQLWYEATIDDPDTFTKPWKISMPLYRRIEKDAQFMEFKCIEFVEELMYGQWRKPPRSQHP